MNLAAAVTWCHYTLPRLPSLSPGMAVDAGAARTSFPESRRPWASLLRSQPPPTPSHPPLTTQTFVAPPSDAAIQFLGHARHIASLSCHDDAFLLGKKVDSESSAVSPGVKVVLHLQQITPPLPRSPATEPSFSDRLMEVKSAPTRCTRRESANCFLYVPFTGKRNNSFFLEVGILNNLSFRSHTRIAAACGLWCGNLK